jgi:small-conductance mechanosensitive channel
MSVRASLVALLTVLFTALPVVTCAQGFPLPIPAASGDASYGFPIRRVGNLDTAPITFEGRQLFTIAAPPAIAENPAPPIVNRVTTIQENMRRIALSNPSNNPFGIGGSRFDASTFKVEVGEENGHPTLYASDGNPRETAPIMTVTEADSALHGTSSSQLAIEWRSVLQGALAPAVRASQPEYFTSQLLRLPLVLLGAALLTWLLSRWRRLLWKRGDEIESAKARIDPADTSEAPEAWHLRLEQTLVNAGPWVLAGLVCAIWVLVALWILSLFPGTRAFAGSLSSRIIALVAVWLAFIVVDRILNVVIVRLSNEWVINSRADMAEHSRTVLRRPTVERALENIKFILLFVLAIGISLSILNISAVSALTIGAFIAFAVSIAAQSVIRDYVNGFLILAEDQFVIGDIVTINNTTGAVEMVTLRIVKLRTDDGKLVTIPNGTITTVENATCSWARVDFRVAISLDSDVERAEATLKAVLDGLAGDARWRSAILEPPRILGIDSVSSAGIVLRAWIKTGPSERSALSREINRRVEEAFRSNGIHFAFPQTMLVQPQATPAP